MFSYSYLQGTHSLYTCSKHRGKHIGYAQRSRHAHIFSIPVVNIVATHSDLARHTSKRLTHTQENTFYSKRTHSTVREHTSKRCLWLFFIRRWLLRTCFFLFFLFFLSFFYFSFIFPAKRRGFSQMKTPPPWPFRLTMLAPCGRMPTIECVLLLQNVFSYYGMTCLECVLLLQNVFSYYGMCSLTTECVRIPCVLYHNRTHSIVFSYYRRCSLTIEGGLLL